MGKLFAYEIKKNILRLSLLFVLLGLAAVNVYKLRETVRYKGSMGYAVAIKGEKDFGDVMKEKFYGEITPQKIDEIKAYSEKMGAIIASGNYDTQNPSDEFYTGYAYGDYNVIGEIRTAVRNAYLYPNTIIELKQRADACIDFFSGKNEYEVRKYELLKTFYNNRKIGVYGDYEAVRLFFDYEFSAFVIMILMIFVFSATFSNERLTGTDKIIGSSGRGANVFWAKQLTLYAFAATMTIIFSITDLIVFGSYYRLGFLEQPLYAVSTYRFTPIDISVLGAVWLSCVFKTIALVFVGEVILLISSLTKNSGAAITLCFAVIGALIFANGYVPEWVSPFTLFSTEKMISEFKCLNVFGYPVPEFAVTLTIAVIFIVTLHVICYRKTARKIKLYAGVNAK